MATRRNRAATMPSVFLADRVTLLCQLHEWAFTDEEIGWSGNSDKWIALLADRWIGLPTVVVAGADRVTQPCERATPDGIARNLFIKTDTTARKMAADAAIAVREPLQE